MKITVSLGVAYVHAWVAAWLFESGHFTFGCVAGAAGSVAAAHAFVSYLARVAGDE